MFNLMCRMNLNVEIILYLNFYVSVNILISRIFCLFV